MHVCRHEAMSDLVYLLNTLVDKDGRILIPNLYKEVKPLTAAEEELYKQIEFDVSDYRSDVGCKRLAHNEDKIQLLMHRYITHIYV